MRTPVKSLFGRAARVVFILVLLIVAAGLIAPFITMARYSGRIREALETALGRSVEFQKLHLTLFSGPGFELDDVMIGEDPRFGLEPFAYVPTLEARVRLDKLLLGRIQFSSLRLVEPSLNLVKESDGTWNVVGLVERLSSPRRVPLNLFPVVEISDGRLNFKFGTRKTTLYISDSDLSIYPESSGKLYLQFSGSPARTDRAGNGFGHFHGTANWYVSPKSPSANQLEADLTLDRSNLSEMTNLFEGYDVGVHGTVSSHMRIAGPAADLRLTGDLHLEDVHRWDLLPASGEDWHVHYQGQIDLLAHRLNIETAASAAKGPAPVTVQLHVNDFLRTDDWTITTQMTQAPAQNLLPLASRMGLSLPENLSLKGALNGTVSYSGQVGLSGEVTMTDLATNLPGAAALKAKTAAIAISSGRFHLADTTFETAEGQTLKASGDYFPETRQVTVSLHVANTPTNVLKSEATAWLGEDAKLDLLDGGETNGHLEYSHTGTEPAQWSGQLQFSGASLSPPGIASPLRHSSGRLSFHDLAFQIDRLSAMVSDHELKGSYRYTPDAKVPERLHLQIPAMDVIELEKLLKPTLGHGDLWTRLHFARPHLPGWLADRKMEGTFDVAQLTAGELALGSFRSRFTWKGSKIEFTSLESNLPQGLLRGTGDIELSGNAPSYHFASSIAGFPYKDGLLSADGQFQSSGDGADAAENFHATGTFSGTHIVLSPDDTLDRVSGMFRFSMTNGSPDLRLSQMVVSESDEEWTGEGSSENNGTLVFNFQNEGRQRQVVTPITSQHSMNSSEPELQGSLHPGGLR